MASMLQNMIRLGVLPGKDAAYAHKIIIDDKPIPQAMFATTDLKTIQRPFQDGDPQDIEHEGQIYRKVDLLFWAWLWVRMEKAELAHKTGTLDAGKWMQLQKQFGRIHNPIVDHHSSKALEQAVTTIRQTPYNPPATSIPAPAQAATDLEWRFPPQGEYFAFERVTLDAVKQVEAIKNLAIAQGWTMAGLFQNRGNLAFPIGQDWGLVCFLGENRFIQSVSYEFIEIAHHEKNGRTSRLHFRNPELMKGQPNQKGDCHVQ